MKLAEPEEGEDKKTSKNNDGESFITKLNRMLREPLHTKPSFMQICLSLFKSEILQNHMHKDNIRLRKYTIVSYSEMKKLADGGYPLCELAVSGHHYLTINTGGAYTHDFAREVKREERMAMSVSPTIPPSIESIAQHVPVYDHVRWNDMIIWIAKVLPLTSSFKPVCAKNQDGARGYTIKPSLTTHVYLAELKLLMERPEFTDILLHVSKPDTIDITIMVYY